MAWIILLLAALCEMAWPLGVKFTAGFTKHPVAAVATFAIMLLSFVLMGLATRTLPVGTAYAVWTGLGTVGIVLISIALFGEPATAPRIACLALIVVGVVGLRYLEGAGSAAPPSAPPAQPAPPAAAPGA